MQTTVSLNFIYALGKWKMLAETYNKANLRCSEGGKAECLQFHWQKTKELILSQIFNYIALFLKILYKYFKKELKTLFFSDGTL